MISSFRLYRLALIVIVVAMASPLRAQNTPKAQPLESLKLKSGDEVGNDQKGLRTELLIANTEQKAIDQIQKLIKKYRGTELEADLQFRLADLHMRRAKTDRFLKLHKKSGAAGELKADIVNKAEPKKHIGEAIKIYISIAKKWPRFLRLDEVFYNHAFAEQQLANDRTAEKLFEKLITSFPNSRLIPDAHLAVGELNFQRANFKQALVHFNAIKSFPDSMVYPYGLYKGAWTHYNLRDAHAGLLELEAVIKFGRFVRDQGIDARLDLRREALTDMALFFEDVYPAKRAFTYFESQADELDVAPVVLRLSSLYKRHSRFDDNRIVLRDFIMKRGGSDYIPTAYVELMDSTDKLKKYPDVVKELREFSSLCDAGSKWVTSQKVDWATNKEGPLHEIGVELGVNPTLEGACRLAFQRTALTYANRWLKMWQKDNSLKLMADVTEDAFRVYLEKDPKTEVSAKARFVYSELLFQRLKFRDASINYEIAGALTKDATMAHDAQYFAIISLEKAVPEKWSDVDETRFKTLAATYLKAQKTPKYGIDVKFKQALIAYEKSKYDEAAKGFITLGDQYPTHEKGIKSQDLYLDILNVQKKFKDLKLYSDRQRKLTKDSSRRAKLDKIFEQSYFYLVQQDEEAKKFDEAITGYKQFAKDNSGSPLAKEALWNALQLQFKSGDLAGGAESAVMFADTFRMDSKAKDALMKAAQTYESMGQLKLAAEVLGRLTVHDKKEASRWMVLAADFYFLSDQYQKANQLYVELLKDKDKDIAFRSLQQLQKIATISGNKKDEDKWLKEIVVSGREPFASDAAYIFLERQYATNDFSKVFVDAKSIVGRKSASPMARGKARLLQARILAQEYKSQSLKSRLDRVQIVLQLKTEKLGKAQVAYQEAAGFGDPKVAVVALKELGDLYLDYSQSLKKMETPVGVPPEEEAIFRTEMNKLALPMEEKGYETKALALKEAQSFGIRDGLLQQLQAELSLGADVTGREPLILVEPAKPVLPASEGVGT